MWIDEKPEILNLDRLGGHTCQHVKCHHRHRIQITRRFGLPHQLLGRHITIRPGHRRSAVFDLWIRHRAKIDQPNSISTWQIFQHDIARFDIAMNNRRIRMVQSF